MRLNFNICLGIFLLVAFGACTDRELFPKELPEPSQSGENTLGFLVNADVWVHQQSRATASFRIAEVQDGCLSINGFRQTKKGINELFLITICNFDGTGEYNFVLEQGNSAKVAVFTQDGKEFLLQSGERNFGRLVISKYDVAAGIISGSFDFDLYASDSQKVSIRDGRFDAKL